MSNYALYLWSPATGPVNLAFVQPETFGGSGFPPEKMGHAFVTESGATYGSGPSANGKRIREFVLDPNGNLVSGPTNLVEYTGTGRSTVVGLSAGPDGLYFTDLYQENSSSPTSRGANVLRVRYVGLPATGNGDGLRGEYYDNINLTGLAFNRTNATLDFNWGSASPDPSIGSNTFSIRWTGQVQPQFSETYTFYVSTDDGVRLWVDNQLLVDNWVDQGTTERAGSIALTAYQRYNIKMEYYENAGSAVARLLWGSPSMPKSVIPQSQLYSGTNQPLPFRFQFITQATNTELELSLSGVPGDIQQIETSTNLVNWTLLEIFTNITGVIAFQVPITDSSAQRFFRSVITTPTFKEIIVDNPSATLVGSWSTGNIDVDKYGPNYYWKTNGVGSDYIQFTPNLPVSGHYQVYEWHTQGSDRTTNAPLIITSLEGVQTNIVNQQFGGGFWNLVGVFHFAAGNTGNLRIIDATADVGKRIGADAIKFVYMSP
jgi:hypothetical protein